jgi:nicotinamide-nucleotide amidase
VLESTLLKYGAVSEETVKEMALGALKNMNTDYALAVSGIAGPSGGSPEKPVGTVWIACATKDQVRAVCYRFGTNRLRVIERAAKQALANLLAELNKNT